MENESNETENEEKYLDVNSSFVLKETLRNLALLFTTVTAITFYNGFFYYGSYLWFWGLAPDLSLINFEEILIRGVEVYCLLFIECIGSAKFLSFLAIPAVLLFVLLFLVSDRVRPTVNKFFDFCDKKFNVKASQQVIIEALVNYLTLIGSVFMLLGLLMFLRTYSVEQGKNAAQKHQKNIVEGIEAKTAFKLLRLSYLDETNQPKTIDTYLINASSTHQAFYVEPDILVLPILRILSIRNIGVKLESKAISEIETSAETEATISTETTQ